MRDSKRIIIQRQFACAVLAFVLLAVPAMADVFNGDFENGGNDWIEFADPGLFASFPPAGGNDGGYAHLESESQNQGGFVCISQTIQCGVPDPSRSCTIGFDFKLTPIDASPGTGRIIVSIDGVTSVVVDVGTPEWEFVSYVVPCGDHVLDICLEVDPENNSWVACIDNVRAECNDVVPNERDSWGSLKTLYR